MVTAYYISKLSKKSDSLAIDEDYQYLLKNFVYLKSTDNVKTRCRVCLKPSSVPIYDNYKSSDILKVLKTWAGVSIEENDDYPQSLCTRCYMFVKTANLFKEKATQTQAALKQHHHFKVEAKCADSAPSQEFNEEDNSYDDAKTDETNTIVDTWPLKLPVAINVEVNVERNVEKLKPRITCRICGKVVSRSYYRNHLAMHDPNPHQWICEFCGKSFRLRCAYHNHSLSHKNHFPHKCPLCPYRGRSKDKLKSHMRKHSGDRKYMCTECDSRFLFKSNLNTHLLRHKEPQFKCDYCKKAFYTKLHLERHHESAHLGIKNHVCNICEKAFSYRSAMVKHRQYVHKAEKSSFFGRIPSYYATNKQQENN